MPRADVLNRFVKFPWLKSATIASVLVAVSGFGLAFKTSYEIIPDIDHDSDHLVWSAFKIQSEFKHLKLHSQLFELTMDTEHLSEVKIWLDVLYSRLTTLTLGNWATVRDEGHKTASFARALRRQLDSVDRLLQHNTANRAALWEEMQPTLADIDQAIAGFLTEQQVDQREAADHRSAQTNKLLVNQQIMLITIMLSLTILFGLVWLRSRQTAWAATHDPGTGLANRIAVLERLNQLIHTRGQVQIAVHCIDIDRFKMINDTLGHQIGDQLLQRFAKRLQEMAGSSCFVARTGSNQFVLLEKYVDAQGDAMQLANKILFSTTNEYTIDEHQLRIGLSIGIAIAGSEPKTNGSLLERADLALYEAKRRGGGTAIVFDPSLEERAQRHRRIDTDLRSALNRCELVNFYQPKIDLRTRKICGAEALLRWFHPEHGMIRPDHFIPIAEDTRLIIPIGVWAADRACADAKEWSNMTNNAFQIAVNLSPVQFESDMLVSEIRRAIKKYNLDPAALELEITESTLMDHNRQVEMAMKRLRDLGIKFALDDFGTGFSSLSYLDRFRFDKVKIDRSFVMGLDPSIGESPIIEAVVHIGKGYHFDICAEGIEDEAHARLLTHLGCQEAQGYHFGKPMPAKDFTLFLRDHLDQQGQLTSTSVCEPA